MAIASISSPLPVEHFVATRAQTNTGGLVSGLAQQIFSAEEHLRTFVREHPFLEVLKNRAQKIEGCIRIVGWVVLLVDFFKHAFAAGRSARTDFSQEDNRLKLRAETKETFVSLVNFTSVTASLLQWAETVRILVLGKLAPFLQKFICGANLVVSGFGIEKTIHALKKEGSALEEERSLQARDVHKHRYALALVDLAYHISTIAWAVLRLVELVGGIALSPLLTGSLFMVSCCLAFAALVYSLYIEFKIAPPASPPEQASVMAAP